MKTHFEEVDRVLMVGHSCRFTPGVSARKIVQNGEPGRSSMCTVACFPTFNRHPRRETAQREFRRASHTIFGTHLIDLLRSVPLRVTVSTVVSAGGKVMVSITLALVWGSGDPGLGANVCQLPDAPVATSKS